VKHASRVDNMGLISKLKGIEHKFIIYHFLQTLKLLIHNTTKILLFLSHMDVTLLLIVFPTVITL